MVSNLMVVLCGDKELTPVINTGTLNQVFVSKKKSFVIGINPETFQQIEKWADDEFRSVNGQFGMDDQQKHQRSQKIAE